MYVALPLRSPDTFKVVAALIESPTLTAVLLIVNEDVAFSAWSGYWTSIPDWLNEDAISAALNAVDSAVDAAAAADATV